jgi:hypothetical protein
MHLRFVQPALVACFSLLLIYSPARADSEPTPSPPPWEPPPLESPPPIIGETPTPPPAPTPEIRDDLIPPPPATPPPQETPSPPPRPTIPPVTPPPMPSIPPTPGPIVIDPSPLQTPSPPPPPPPLETPTPQPHPTLPPIYPPPVPTVPPRQGIRVGPSATILLPTAEVAVTTSVNSIFQLVALPQDQIVQVTVHYASTDLATASATEAAQVIVRIEAIDGGRVAAVTPPLSAPGNDDGIGFGIAPDQQFTSATVGANGNLTFLFQAGHLPGLYQIRIDRGNEVLGMQFWIRDPQNPGNDPPAMTPAHMEVPSPNPI